MATDLGTLLDAQQIESLPVAGWSMGGFTAQALATRAPQRVEALVLLSTDPGGPTAGQPDPDVWARLTDHSGTRRASGAFPTALFAQKAAMEHWHSVEQPPPAIDSPPVIVVYHGKRPQDPGAVEV